MLTKALLSDFFKRHGFQLINDSDSCLEFMSDRITFKFVRDPREQVYSVFAEWLEHEVEIGVGLLKVFFRMSPGVVKFNDNNWLPLDPITFFENQGKALFNGEPQFLDMLARHARHEAREYTQELVDAQLLQQANTAWDLGDFKGFIKYMDEVRGPLSGSYLLKREIAQRKVDGK